MIRSLRDRSELTILLTTHYMDEADKLCDRIAIVDHGKLAALDTPTRLKDNVPGTEIVEAEFVGQPADWLEQLRGLSHATGVSPREDVVHITSSDGPATVAALMDLARARKVTVKRVMVQTTTLDDVFLHYTGTELRDSLQKATWQPPPLSR
jgi:ABC-2 type transport system ATP-binding protein